MGNTHVASEQPRTESAAGSGSEFVDRFESAWATSDPDRLAALLADDVVLIQPMMPVSVGKAAARESFARLLRMIPDLHVVVHEWAARDDVVLIEFTLTGTFGGREVSLAGGRSHPPARRADRRAHLLLRLDAAQRSDADATQGLAPRAQLRLPPQLQLVAEAARQASVTGSAETLEHSAEQATVNGSANGPAIRLPDGPPPAARAPDARLRLLPAAVHRRLPAAIRRRGLLQHAVRPAAS